MNTALQIGSVAPAPTGYEMTAAAAAAQVKASVEARYVMAARRPRNWDQVRQDLLRECRRPTFANNKSALYHKPIGKGVEGLGIRFVEVALRCMTNVLVEQIMVYEDDFKEVQRVTVTDLDVGNLTYNDDVKVSKTVERSKPASDGSYLSVRQNSRGEQVYTVAASDDDLLNKRGALVSKAIRTLGLRIIPGDLQDECEDVIRAVRTDAAAADPAGERKRIADAFDGIGVRAADLAAYLGHGLDTCSPPELVHLRGLFGAIRDGEATWAGAIANRAAETGAAAAAADADPFGTATPTAQAGAPGATAALIERGRKAKAAAGARAAQQPAADAAAPAQQSIDAGPVFDFEKTGEQIENAVDRDSANLFLDTARTSGATPDQVQVLRDLRDRKWPEEQK